MRARWLGLAATVLALGLGAASGIRVQPAVAEVPDQYVEVQFDTGVTAQSLNGDGSMPTLAEQGFRLLAVPPGMTADEYVADLRKQSNILQAVKSSKVTAAALPNDQFYRDSQAAYLTELGAPQAWDLTTGSNQVIVAVVDSGVDLAHPEFAGRLWENLNDNASDGTDRDKNGCINDRYGCRFVSIDQTNAALCGYTSSANNGNVLDDVGTSKVDIGSHGTSVAGVIGAAGNNGQGIAGIAWNIRLMTVKVLDCQRNGEPFDVAHGIEYAVRNGARVINVSVASKSPGPEGDSPTYRVALQMAQNAGVIVVAASGNFSPSEPVGTRYPAAYTEFPNLIAVGAANNLNGYQWATYSAYGPAVDFAAPASKIATTARTDLAPYVTVGDPAAGFGGGTSFATPFVSGMFALMISRNSRLPASELIQIARETATPAPPAPHGQNWAGSGIINIGAAVARVPMTVEGAPLRDWRDVPPGTLIEAVIDGLVCGTASSDAFGFRGVYRIRVKSDAEQANCGQPGKVVQLYVGGAPAVPTIPWGMQNEDIGLRDKDVSSVSPPPGALVVQPLNGQWSNIAHLEPSGQLPGAASGLPTPWTSIFKWDPAKATLGAAGAYLRFFRGAPSFASDYPDIQQYDAYWVDAPAINVASSNPNPPPGRSILLKPGWNNITYTGTSRAVSDALRTANGKYSQVLQFDNPSGKWLSHIPGQQRFLNDFGGLFTLKVYWVLMTEEATLVMD